MTNPKPTGAPGDFLLYSSQQGTVRVNVYVADETAWLTQEAMAELFGVQVPAIAKHLKNIFDSGELDPASTISRMEIVRQEGERSVTRQIDHYNLDAIIAVGYRVNSYQATRFRIWATNVLREYLIKGFALDDERLKQGKTLSLPTPTNPTWDSPPGSTPPRARSRSPTSPSPRTT